jgi:hypothetical protein
MANDKSKGGALNIHPEHTGLVGSDRDLHDAAASAEIPVEPAAAQTVSEDTENEGEAAAPGGTAKPG